MLILDQYLNAESEIIIPLIFPNKKPTNWWGGKRLRAPLEFDPKQSEAAFSTVFRQNAFGVLPLCDDRRRRCRYRRRSYKVRQSYISRTV